MSSIFSSGATGPGLKIVWRDGIISVKREEKSMMYKMPVYNRLRQHDALKRSSFHTPGHKCSSFLPSDLLRLDYTELPDTDALYEADGIILECEKNLSELFGTKRSLISSGGCTLAIQAMIRLALMRGGKLLCSRNVHRSAVNAMALLGTDTVWLKGNTNGKYTGRADPEEIRIALESDSTIRSVYITSPTYYGEISDIRSISDVCHKHGCTLLVDNAHGSHLKFMKDDIHPITLGADMTACSLHKTLPVLTGGAVLNIAEPSLVPFAKEAMALFGSTSPSYPVMCSIDICTDYFLNGRGKDDYLSCQERVKKINDLALERGVSGPDGLCDPLRVTLCTASAGLTGDEQERYFQSFGIDCEFCDGSNAVFLCSPFNTEEDFQRLEKAINGLTAKAQIIEREIRNSIPEKIMSLRDAVLSPAEMVMTRDAAGRISASTACPCPPGVPLVMPGEYIDKNLVEALLNSGIENIKVCY